MKKVTTIIIICALAHLAFSQNFGIDQPSPTEKLDVNGNIKASGTIGAGGNMRISTSGDAKYEYFGSSSDRGFIGWQVSAAPVGVHIMNRDNSPIILSTTNAERMRIDAAGNVGIGTVSPVRRLEVNNAMKFTNSSSDANDGVIGTAPFSAGLNIVGINTDGGGRKVSWWGSFLQQENPVGNTFVGNSNFTGQIQIQGGSPAAGRVLTSDANGLASWGIPGAGGGTTRPAFSVWQVSMGNPGAGTLVTYNTTGLSQGGGMNLGNGTFTAPVAGLYHFTFSGFRQDGAGTTSIVFWVNGGNQGPRSYNGDASNNYSPCSIATTLHLAAGNTVAVYVESGALHGNANNQFSGFLVAGD